MLWWGTCNSEHQADLQAGPTWAANFIQARSEHCKLMEANPEGVAVSYWSGCHLSTPHFQTAVMHLKAISLVFSSQLWDMDVSADIPAWDAPKFIHLMSLHPYGPMHGTCIQGHWDNGAPPDQSLYVCVLCRLLD